MDEAQFTALVQGLRTEASHWFNNAALLELEKLIVWAEAGFQCWQDSCSNKMPGATPPNQTIESPPGLPTPSGLTVFELKILREVAGLEPISPWGAAIGVALESLRSSGYIAPGTNRIIEPTAKGHEAIERAARSLDNPPSGA